MNAHLTPEATHYPLLGARDPQQVVAWFQGEPVTAQQFLAQAQALAQTLTQTLALTLSKQLGDAAASCYAFNLCESPYLFLLGFAATLIAGHPTLLPPNRLTHTLRRLAQQYTSETQARCYVLSDAPPNHQQQDSPASDAHDLPIVRIKVPTVDALAMQPSSYSPPLIAASQLAAVLFTSGSTGHSQACPKPWRTLVLGAAANAKASLASIAAQYPHTQATLLGTVPTQHSYGFEMLVMLPSKVTVPWQVRKPFFAADVAKCISSHPVPRVLVTTPIHMRSLAHSEVSWPALAAVWSATAPLPVSLATQCEQQLRARVHEIFGCTEVGSFASRRTTEHSAWQLLDEFNLLQNVDGTWLIHGRHVPAAAPLQDRITQPSPRQFVLLGRGTDLINIAGKRGSLLELNQQLLSIPGIEDGVIFLPNDDEGDDHDATLLRTAALVVAPTLSTAQVMAALRERIEAAFVPRPLLKVDALPRNDTGKLPRAALLQAFDVARSGGDSGRQTATGHG